MIYALLSTAFYMIQGLSNKEFSKRLPARFQGLTLFNALALSMMAGIMALLGGAIPARGGLLLLALAYGIVFVLTISLMVVSLNLGPLAPATLIWNMSMVLPVLVGVLVWHEQLTLLKVMGIACMVAVLALSAIGNRGPQKTMTLKWFLVTLVVMVLNGSLGVLQQLYTRFFSDTPVQAMSFYFALFGALASWLGVAFFWLRGERFQAWFSKPKALFGTALGIALGTAGGTSMQMLALRTVPGVVVFPLIQGTVILATWVASVILYRERVTRAGLLALLLGILGIVLLNG